MSDKETIKKLYDVVVKQQVIIKKLAQAVAPHRDEVTHGLTNSQQNPNSEHQTPAQTLKPNEPKFRDAEAILKYLPPVVRAAVSTIQVQPSRDPNFDGVVKVLFNAGKASDAAFNTIQKVISILQQKNILQGKNYQIQQVA